MASISFRNVTKRFGDTVAVDNVTLDIRDNAFFCLFGPPLSGKSTILKLILGLEHPDEGEILIDGRPVTNVSPAKRNVAMVFQNLALFPHMTALKNIRFPLVERRIDPQTIAARVTDVTDKLHIGHILHKPPAQLSGGERQRVAIARALVRDPVAYLMDDPISALDARLREETRVELRRIQQQMGKTLVYVTHDQEEAMSVADSMAIFENGKVRQTGKPEDLYRHPNSTYVASMLGAPAMNVVPMGLASGLQVPNMPTRAESLGVRPENLRIASGQGATITEVEPLGGFTTLTVDLQGTPLRATLRGQPRFSAGESVALSVDAGRAHFFDPAGAVLVAQ
ncbi:MULTISPECIES: ABC transporter ATP-binding protein [Roseobacteraceae]|jgi:multiple sugar transport system ATP-binding protein|uniref:Maltose/maltodextrin import ATP-binding protein MalK n=1 Tax=Pseudosulfitobacter pseudonitzschiae TaxID=1402135 RepID=A0A221K6C6_9RHOB|nr:MULTISPECIES: ABC transporter ATP-binding protein [Roseobacteraceae]ASM74564.1 maltose/maltodextrin import ATP-binding protein MalK [Pseudosulfitobacter pseudonitzschiae]